MLENYILVRLLYYFPNESYYCPTHHRRWAKLVIYQSKRSSTSRAEPKGVQEVRLNRASDF